MTSLHRRAQRLVLALAAIVAAGLTAGAATAAATPVVNTTSGQLHGLQTAQTRQFLGVRYAQPPVGALRWAPPQPVSRATGSVAATHAGAPCAQGSANAGAKSLVLQSRSEDCLFLNVTEPTHVRAGERLPVMVWVHGGGYTSGAGAQYDATRMADQGHVIVVTVNFRLGVFGYLDLPGLPGGGDFGLLDVIQALRWVHQNAGAFWGDDHNVTLFGESSGAMQTCALMTSPQARGLFQKLAGSSGGSCNLNWPKNGLLPTVPASTPYVPAKVGEALGVSAAKKLGCSGSRVIACMRSRPVRALLPLMAEFSNVLAYDTPLLPRNPATAVRAGKFLRVPVLMGGNRHEENSFVAGAAQTLPHFYTAAHYPKLLKAAFGARAAAVAARYPLSSYPSPAGAFATLITDDSWSCASLAGDQALARDTRVYAYQFDDPHSPNVNHVHAAGVPQGSAHATDLPYLFDLGGKNALTNPASVRLAKAMIAAYTSFAHTGHPTVPGTPAWPAFSSSGDSVQDLAASGIAPVDLSAQHSCAFWRRVNPLDRP